MEHESEHRQPQEKRAAHRWPERKLGPRSSICKELDSAKDLNELRSDSTQKSPEKNTALLIPWSRPCANQSRNASLANQDFRSMEVRNKNMLFQDTKFGVMCHSSNRKLIYLYVHDVCWFSVLSYQVSSQCRCAMMFCTFPRTLLEHPSPPQCLCALGCVPRVVFQRSPGTTLPLQEPDICLQKTEGVLAGFSEATNQ